MKKISTLFLSLLFTGAAIAQIPNPGFENWTAKTGYDDPDGWSTLDSAGSTVSLITCVKGSPGYGGSAHQIELTSKAFTFGSTTISVPGIAVSGKISVSGTSSFSFQSGFALGSRPQSLTGEWQYAPAGSDQGFIMVLLTKWNTVTNQRDTISFTNQALSGSVTTMAPFTFDLNYLHGDVPDSGIIMLSSSQLTGGADGSYLNVDDLAFTGSVPNGVVTVNNTTKQISLFPNPASIYTNISYNSTTAGAVNISIINLAGKTVKEMTMNKIRGGNDFPIDVTKLTVGIYYVKITDDQGTTFKKLVVE